MHSVRNVAYGDWWSLNSGLLICMSVTRLSCGKVAGRIAVLFRVETLEDRRHIVLHGVPIFWRWGEKIWERTAHCKIQESCSHLMRLSPNYFDFLFSVFIVVTNLCFFAIFSATWTGAETAVSWFQWNLVYFYVHVVGPFWGLYVPEKSTLRP